MLSVQPDYPVDELTVQVLRRIDNIARDMGLPFFIAGAMARDILLTNVFGIQTTRATHDVDLAVALKDWKQFDALKNRLIATGNFDARPQVMQQINYKPEKAAQGYPVDLIPFGGLEGNDHVIAWPPDMKIIMNVIGYEEALSSAVPVLIDKDLSLPIASLPGLALLKLFAWLDRHSATAKDAQDFVMLCRSYFEAGNQDRLYGDEIDIFASVDYDPEQAGAKLLGKDVRAIAAPDTLQRAITSLSDEKVLQRLITHMAIELKARDDSIAAAEQLFAQFWHGLSGDESSSRPNLF